MKKIEKPKTVKCVTTLRCDLDLWFKLRKLAFQERRSINSIFIIAVQEYLWKRK